MLKIKIGKGVLNSYSFSMLWHMRIIAGREALSLNPGWTV